MITLNLKRRVIYQDSLNSLDLGGASGNGTPLQYSCLENPIDGGSW